jgi:hypothetical protein
LPAILLGDPEYAKYGKGLGFRYHQPTFSLWRLLRRPITPLPAWRANPVGLSDPGGQGDLIRGYCPPNYPSTDAAIDDLIAKKYLNPDSTYRRISGWDQVFKDGMAKTFIDEVTHYDDDVINCAKDVCNYIYNTYGRFPAHVDAIWAPGVWLQAHHVDLEYYERFFRGGNTETQRRHIDYWQCTRHDS